MTPDRKALALRVLETVSDFGPLREWALGQRETLLNDLHGLDPAQPDYENQLKYIHGRLSYNRHWLTLEKTVRDIANPPQGA